MMKLLVAKAELEPNKIIMFKLLKKSNKSKARLGELKTQHGKAQTPFFMPVATRGAVKTLSADDIRDLKTPIVLSNTYHLFQRPGEKILKKFKGLHNLMNWKGLILTDSGGFQVFSLSKLRKISSEGVEFSSPYDGAKHLFTPESVLNFQQIIGSDVHMILDVCSPAKAPEEQIIKDMAITHQWANRALKWREKHKIKNLVFCIVQGGINAALRKESAETLANMQSKKASWDGFAIGGLAVGESEQEMIKTVKVTTPYLPEDKPRYLMGVGYPHQVVEAVKAGVDMFDCVIPSREARHGRLYFFTKTGGIKLFGNLRYKTININSAIWKENKKVINSKHSSRELKTLSFGYLHHLFRVGEPLALRLATLQNIWFYLEMMRLLREEIKKGKI